MPADKQTAAEVDPVVAATEAAAMKKKKILIAVLLVGLIIAVLTQPDSEDESTVDVTATPAAMSADAPAATPASLAPAAVSTPAAPADRDAANSFVRRSLSRVEMDVVKQLELFAPEPRIEVKQKAAPETREVRAIYGTSRGGAALLGESIIRDGEPLPGGVQVLRVHERGVDIGAPVSR